MGTSRRQKRACKSSVNGEHEYIYYEKYGEECKHCGLLRSTMDGITQPRPDFKLPPMSPSTVATNMAEEANTPAPVHIPVVVTKKEAESFANNEHLGISDQTYEDILEAENAGAALVITFDEPIMSNPARLKHFHVSGINITREAWPAMLMIVAKSLAGDMPGAFVVTEAPRPEQKPQP